MDKTMLPLIPNIQSSSEYNPQSNVVLHEGDSNEFLKTIPRESVNLIITSPPYNLGKEYETKTSIEKYLAQQESLIDKLISVLSPRGSLCWEVGNWVNNGEVFPLDTYYYPLFKKHSLKLRNRIIWHFGHGLHASKRFSGRYETILWFTKTDDYIFNLNDIRIPSKYPGKTYYKGPNRGKPSGNPFGKNPSDIWEILIEDWDDCLWNIPNVKANHPEKTEHPCQFPIELVERCVLALTNENDWLLDPYCGVGSALIAGLMHNRRVIGCDTKMEYIKIASDRISQLNDGTLKIRPLGRKVFQPTGREKVSQVPISWLENNSIYQELK